MFDQTKYFGKAKIAFNSRHILNLWNGAEKTEQGYYVATHKIKEYILTYFVNFADGTYMWVPAETGNGNLVHVKYIKNFIPKMLDMKIAYEMKVTKEIEENGMTKLEESTELTEKTLTFSPLGWMLSVGNMEMFHLNMDINEGYTFKKKGCCYVNTFQGFLHHISQAELETPFTAEENKAIASVNNFITEVICSNDKKIAQHLIYFLANIANAQKNTCNLGLLGKMGVGKSSILNWFCRDVIGWNAVWVPSDVEHFLDKYSGDALEGRVFIMVEELEMENSRDYKKVNAKLKNIATDDQITIRKMRQGQYKIKNTLSFATTMNYSSLHITKQDRRWFMPEVSSKYQVKRDETQKQMEDFWDNIHDNVLNRTNGRIYFKYLMTLKTKAKSIIDKKPPITKTLEMEMTKKDELNHTYSYILKHYLTQDLGLHITSKALTDLINSEYKTKASPRKTGNELSKLDIKSISKRIDGKYCRYFEVSYRELYTAFTKKLELDPSDYDLTDPEYVEQVNAGMDPK